MLLLSLISWSSFIFNFVNILINSTELTGFKIYSSTSRWTASFAYSNSSKPVKSTIFIAGYSLLIWLHSSMPSIYGILISVITTSGWLSSIISSALIPLSAYPTTENPISSQLIFRIIAYITSSSSSTKSIVYLSILSPYILFRFIFPHYNKDIHACKYDLIFYPSSVLSVFLNRLRITENTKEHIPEL